MGNAHSRQVSNHLPREEKPSQVCESLLLLLKAQTQQVSGIGAREGTKTRDLFPLQKKERGKKSTEQGKKEPEAVLLASLPQSPKEATQRNKRKIFSPKETLVKTHLLKHKKFCNTSETRCPGKSRAGASVCPGRLPQESWDSTPHTPRLPTQPSPAGSAPGSHGKGPGTAAGLLLCSQRSALPPFPRSNLLWKSSCVR